MAGFVAISSRIGVRVKIADAVRIANANERKQDCLTRGCSVTCLYGDQRLSLG